MVGKNHIANVSKMVFGTLVITVLLFVVGILYYEWIEYCTAVDCVGGDIGN